MGNDFVLAAICELLRGVLLWALLYTAAVFGAGAFVGWAFL